MKLMITHIQDTQSNNNNNNKSSNKNNSYNKYSCEDDKLSN